MTSVKEVLNVDVEAVKSQIAHLEQLVQSCDECAHYAPILEERRGKHRLLSAMLALEVSPAAGTLQEMLKADIAVTEQQIPLYNEYTARFGTDNKYAAILEKKQEKLRKLTALLALEPSAAGGLQGTLEQEQQQQQPQLRPSSRDAKRGCSPDDGPECSDSKRQRQQHNTVADDSGGCGGSMQGADGNQPQSLPGTQSPQHSQSEQQRPQPQHPPTPEQAGSHPHGLGASMAAAAPAAATAAPAAAGPSVPPSAATLPAYPLQLPERLEPVSSASEGMTVALPEAAESPTVVRHSSTGAQAAAARAGAPVHALEDSIQCDNGRLRLPAWLILQNGIASCHEVTVIAHPSGSTFGNVPKRLGTAGQYISKRDWTPIARHLGVQDMASVTAWCRDSEPRGTFHVARAERVQPQTAQPQQQQLIQQPPVQPQQPPPPSGSQPPQQPPQQPSGQPPQQPSVAQHPPTQSFPARQQPEEAPAPQQATGAGGMQQAGAKDDVSLQPRRAALQAQGIWQAVVLQDQVLDEALPPLDAGPGGDGGGGGGQSQSWQGGVLPGGGWAGIAAALPQSGSRRRTLRPPVPCGIVGIKVNMKKQPGRLYVSADYTWLLCQGRRRPDACTFVAVDGEHSVRKEVKFRNSTAGAPTPFPGMEAVEGWNTICTFLGLREHSVIGLCWRGTVPDEVEVVKVDHGPSSWAPPEVPHWAKLAYSSAGDCVGGSLADAAPAAAVASGSSAAVPMGVPFVTEQAAAAEAPAGAAAPTATAAAQHQPLQPGAPVPAPLADPLPSAANRDPRRAAAAAAAASGSPPPGTPAAAGGHGDTGAQRVKQESPPASGPPPPYRLLLEGRLGPQEPSGANLRAFMAAALAAMRGGKDAWPFLEPVSAAAVPNYYDVIKNPMDMRTIGERMERGYYRSLHTFAADFRRIFANARTFNPPRTFFYKAADKLESTFNTYIGARVM